MINVLELEILRETLDYMKENCIGPQNAYFLFKAIKNKFKDSFSYSFFISLFDNQEVITKNLVELKVLDLNIDKNAENEEKSNYPSTQPKTDLPPSSKKENKHKSIFQSNDEEYYYFTKTNKTLKSKLLTEVLNFFNEENKNILDIKNIYSFLQQTFKMNSINMGNLKVLLKSERNVLKSTIHELLIEFPPQEAESHLFDLNKLLVSKRKDFIKVLTVMGLDFMKDIIRNGISNYISYLNSFTEFDLNFTSNLQLVDPNQDKILNDSDAMLFLNFLNIFTEQELIDILNNEETLKEVLLMFMEDEKKKKDKAEFSKTIKELFLNVNEDNQNAKIRFLLPYEVVPYFQKEKISTLREVDKLTLKSLESIYNYRQIIIDYIKVLQHSLPVYLNEKFKLLIQRVNASNIPNSLWEKYVEAMCYREKGYNLEQTAQKLGMTRERIRQIERKYFFLFNEFYNSRNGTLTRLIRAFSKSDFYLTLEDINSIFSFYPNLFIYMLKKTESTEDITYIDELNVFYFVDEVDWYKELLVESEQIEDIVDENKMNEIINKTHDKLIHLGVDIPKEFCIKVLSQDFKLNGTFYSRSKMSLTSKYKRVLEKHFIDGIAVYRPEQIAEFKKNYNQMFSDDKIPDNDRAVYGRITAICYLKDKGFYKLKQDHYISEELAIKIYNYIIESPRDIFLTNTLFALFEDELLAEGIENKYNLQGVLREIYGNELFFSRDYISKTQEKSSIYSDIYDFIKQIDKEISYQDLKEEFVGVPDSVIALAISNEKILNCRRSYIHADNLRINQIDQDELEKLISNMVTDGNIHNAQELFLYLDVKNKDLLIKHNIETQYKLFSIISYIFQDKFEFQRPFFALKGVSIGKQNERITEFIRDHEELTIEELLEFVYSNKLHLYSIVDFINSLNDEYVFKDKDTIITLDNSKINKYNTKIAEDVIINAMKDDGFIVAANFSAYNFLPREVKWTDWLLYSALNKYSNEIKVFTSSNQMRYSKPIFVKKEIPAKNLDELVVYLKRKLDVDEVSFIKYLKIKGLME